MNSITIKNTILYKPIDDFQVVVPEIINLQRFDCIEDVVNEAFDRAEEKTFKNPEITKDTPAAIIWFALKVTTQQQLDLLVLELNSTYQN